LSELSNDATRSTTLEKEMKEKNLLISKLRHDGESGRLGRLCSSSVALLWKGDVSEYD
jgi:hypothetical protein